jgi:hypothetical protein
VGEVVTIKSFKRARAEGKRLCSSGFHKWDAATEKRFDVKQGKLVSTDRCIRCGAERNRLT